MKILIALVLPLFLLGSAVVFATAPIKKASHNRVTQSATEHGVSSGSDTFTIANLIR
ncbi:MAG TPA: hypothetical protein VMB49_18155 [Acidobacteriaceae bacterium]|nr:hypothetical protein [Acidobacteriaceae bacterium]